MVKSKAASVDEYVGEQPEEKRKTLSKVRKLVLGNLPKGYHETMNWGMITYEIPLEKYPDTYNGKPLGYVAIASQKNYFALYLMSVYQSPGQLELLKEGFEKEGKKLDMGKSCLRFKSFGDLPQKVLGKIIASTPPAKYIKLYQASKRVR